MDVILLEKAERIATITINRPKAMNALNNEVFHALSKAFEGLEQDDEVDLVLITGAGEKAFVAGADIKELAELDAMQAKAQSQLGQRVFRQIEQCSKPVIALVNGFALGGGCELAMACHMRVAAENAKFGLPEVGLGLIPGYAGTQRLPRLVGKGVALELVLTGDMISAARAAEIGLANHVVPAEELADFGKKFAGKILSKGQLAVRAALEVVTTGADLPEERAELFESGMFGVIAGGEDAREGLSAFIEKRKPNFKGK